MRRLTLMMLLWGTCIIAGAARDPRLQWSTEVHFDNGSAQLRADAKAKLDEVFRQIAELDPEVVMAIGHTDGQLSEGKAQRLSIARAEAVKAYLGDRGYERNRVYTEGKGHRMPVGDNATQAGRAQNNRVDIQLVGKRIYRPGQTD